MDDVVLTNGGVSFAPARYRRRRRSARIPGRGLSASLFDFFDITPALGRFFTAEEDTPPAGGDVVVLSHAFWQAAYGGRNPIGELLLVGNVPATIVGVAPERFTGIADGPPPAVFVPITAVGYGLRFATAGVTLGTALAFAASPWIEPLQFRQSPRDPAPFATAGLILLVTALVANY